MLAAVMSNLEPTVHLLTNLCEYVFLKSEHTDISRRIYSNVLSSDPGFSRRSDAGMCEWCTIEVAAGRLGALQHFSAICVSVALEVNRR